MNTTSKKHLHTGIFWLVAFCLWTLAVSSIDLQPLGPGGSQVGLGSINGPVQRLIGFHRWLYELTDLLSIIPLCCAAALGLLGLTQWIRRRHLLRVDRSILVLGIFYMAVGLCFLLFEQFPVNFRPVLAEGVLEASYPSSTTLLVLTVMPTATLQLRQRVKNCRMLCTAIQLYSVLMVMGRLLSGVHWATDIAGGMLLAAGLVELYRAFAD